MACKISFGIRKTALDDRSGIPERDHDGVKRATSAHRIMNVKREMPCAYWTISRFYGMGGLRDRWWVEMVGGGWTIETERRSQEISNERNINRIAPPSVIKAINLLAPVCVMMR